MITANHLKIPTFSLSKKIDNIVVNIGAAKDMLTTVANGNCLKAINIAIRAINPEPHLKDVILVVEFCKNYEIFLLEL